MDRQSLEERLAMYRSFLVQKIEEIDRAASNQNRLEGNTSEYIMGQQHTYLEAKVRFDQLFPSTRK